MSEKITIAKLTFDKDKKFVFVTSDTEQKYYFLKDKIKNFLRVGDEILVEANPPADGKVSKQITKIYDKDEAEPPPEALQPEKKPPEAVKVLGDRVNKMVDQFNAEDMRLRSMALSYSKDMVVAGKITHADLLKEAEGLYFWLITGKLIKASLPTNVSKPKKEEPDLLE